MNFFWSKIFYASIGLKFCLGVDSRSLNTNMKKKSGKKCLVFEKTDFLNAFKNIMLDKLHTPCKLEGAKLKISKHDVFFQKLLNFGTFDVKF